jgi:Flp pilus assembly protein TadD
MLSLLHAGILLASGPWLADVVTLKTGEQLDCLVIDVDERQVKVRRGSEGVTEFRQISRSEVTEIRLSTPDVTGFRTVAKRFESDRWVREATDVWRQVCVLRPEGVQDQLTLAQSYRRTGRLEDAAAAALAAAKADSRDPKVPLEQGEIALATGDATGAVRFAREALRQSTLEPEGSRWLLARALEGAGLTDDAMGEYARLLQAEPRNGDLLDRYVDLALRQKRVEAAVPEVTRVTRAAADLRSSWIALGRLLYRLDRMSEAESAFRTATSLGGSDYNRARVYFQCTIARRYGRNPELVLNASDLKVAVDLDPSLRRDTP